MSEKANKPVLDTDTKSIQAVPPPVARWKRWHFRSSIVLMFLGAAGILIYLLRSGMAKEYEGVGVALCVVACGGFLVWHVIHLFAEQDKLQKQLLGEAEATVSSPRPNPTGKETDQTGS